MKSTLFAIIGMFAATAFAADSYTIDQFSGEEVGTPDQYIDAEFGGSLKVSATGSVENVQDGRFYVRQKFEDPFGDAPTTYQLYEGREGSDKANLAEFTLPDGIAYGFIVKAKAYASEDADANSDIEKVYFDGKSVFAEGVSEMYVHRGVRTIALISAGAESSSSYEEDSYAAAAPVEESSSSTSSDDEYCDDNDPDCEEEDDYNYDVRGDVGATASRANDEDYATSAAASDVTDRFGIADEVRKWSAWGLVGIAAAGIGVGIYDQMQYSDAKSAYDGVNDVIDSHKANIESACGGKNSCYEALLWYEKQDNTSAIYQLEARNKKNKDTMDSYSMARNIWFGVAAASIAGAIVLFTW
ncbi:MAG: hypothetical protein J6Z31_10795 [Fibrobacter sp.]|nr:hypothetical protein [Fibrobacter sp.]